MMFAAYAMICVAFLGFSGWMVVSGHEFFGPASFVVAACMGFGEFKGSGKDKP